MPAPSPLILFDFNGVIADDEPVHQQTLQAVLAEEGITVTDAEYRDTYLGYDDRGCFTAAFADVGQDLPADRLAALITRKSARYDAHIAQHLVLFPGAVACVEALSAAFVTGIVSGALRGEIDAICGQAGIRDAFQFVVAAEDTAACKPHPEGYLKGLAHHNLNSAPAGVWVDPAQCVVIEDSIAGVAAAKAAGMRCLAVTHTYPATQLSLADLVVDTIAEISPNTIRAVTGG